MKEAKSSHGDTNEVTTGKTDRYMEEHHRTIEGNERNMTEVPRQGKGNDMHIAGDKADISRRRGMQQRAMKVRRAFQYSDSDPARI